MKILMINKFLHPNGGSETYIFKLGEALKNNGHEVQYFGMDHPNRCVGNKVNAYTSNMDFHGGSKLSKVTYPIKTIYSVEARKKIRLVLDDFQPDVCHLNNFNYQLTPSVILEIRKWERESGQKVKVVLTAHDPQLVCPNHMMKNGISQKNCEKCVYGQFRYCTMGKCIHASLSKSIIGTVEAYFWKWIGVYRKIDIIISPSRFLKSKLDMNPVLAKKTVVLRNFVDGLACESDSKKDYVLYFGRYSEEKGVKTLIAACKELEHVQFVFAGSGPLESEVNAVANIKNVGFQTGLVLAQLIGEARFSVCPSVIYENCPFSVMESQLYGTPVLGADIGGIPELIAPGKTGELFQSGDSVELRTKILMLWENHTLTDRYSRNCKEVVFDTVDQYCEKLISLYQ